jgi:hypothetical protein
VAVVQHGRKGYRTVTSLTALGLTMCTIVGVNMALIKCPDCGRDVSDAAIACPQCGRPVTGAPRTNQEPTGEAASAAATAPDKPPPKKSEAAIGCATLLFIAVVIGMIVERCACKSAEEEAAEIPRIYKPAAAPAEEPKHYNTVSMDDLLATMERQGDGYRVRVTAETYKFLHEGCGAMMIRKPGDPMDAWRCDISCDFNAGYFPIGQTMAIDATVKHLGLTECKPSGR